MVHVDGPDGQWGEPGRRRAESSFARCLSRNGHSRGGKWNVSTYRGAGGLAAGVRQAGMRMTQAHNIPGGAGDRPASRVSTPELLSLLAAARAARERAFAPYSGFKVGSAVLTSDGRIVIGANVENASYGLTVCAERNAILRAIIDGLCAIRAIAVCAEPAATPCGMCRQTLVQFADDDCPVVIGTPDASAEPQIKRLGDLLPDAFRFSGPIK